MNLALVPLNEDFEIVKIKLIKDDSQKKLLNNMGFVEGAVVTVVSESYGNLIVKIKGSRVAIGKDIAMRIMVNHI